MSAYGDPKRGSPVPPYHPSTPLNQAPPGVYGAYQPVSYAYIAPVTHTAPPVIPVVLVQDGGFRRLWRSTFCTIIMWTMIALIVPRIVVELFWHKHHFHAGWPWVYRLSSGHMAIQDVEIPGEVTILKCVETSEWDDIPGTRDENFLLSLPTETALSVSGTSISQKSFNLPIDSDNLLLLSTGGLSYGLVNVVTSPRQTHDAATVRVVVNYYKKQVRDSARVCLIDRKEGEHGVGIFTPMGRFPRRREDRLFFTTTIVLPETEASQTFVKKLETRVANTMHNIEELGTTVLFDSLDLVGSNGFVLAKSLTAKELKIKTLNAAIRGTFNTTDSIVLETSNAPILVDVGMLLQDGSLVTANLHTSNERLKAHFSLRSNSESGGSAFNVSTSTSNSPLDVTFPAAPVDSKLHYDGRTSNSPARVSLNPAYEGTFDVKTSIFSASIKVDNTVQDPKGEDRKRQVVSRSIRGRQVTGYVRWYDEDVGNLGSVKLRSSNMPAELSL